MSSASTVKMSRMIADIDRDYFFTRGITGRERLPEYIRKIFVKVPRHEFVPSDLQDLAYENCPLSIGHGQTISQPFIVALMTDLLNPRKGDHILEVGCGCGYQAAILSLLVAEVYSTEIISDLVDLARERLIRLGFNNVTVDNLDGYFGWPQHEPFDGIIVAAAAASVPEPLVKQLKTGGRLVMPLGSPYGSQKLVMITKGEGAVIHTAEILPVAFVPLTGGH